MDILTFIFWYLICSIVLFSIIGLIIWLIIRHKAIVLSKTYEDALVKVLEKL